MERYGRKRSSREALRRAATTTDAGVSWCIVRPVSRPWRVPADPGGGLGVRRREPLPELNRDSDDRVGSAGLTAG